LIIHLLNHHAVPLEVIPYIVSSTTTTATPSYLSLPSSSTPSILQPVNLLLPSLRPLLRLLKLLLQLFELAILLRVPDLLAVLFAAVGDALPEAHGGCEGADKRRGERCDDEGFL
jgi:hypothetical protein